ncbi:MAG: TerB family tellurite resistance protein [Rhizobiaceae bacterium]|nr:TerB family tellurite resistance protein [Rhizobiaceae bacterium]
MLEALKNFIRDAIETPEPETFLHDRKQLAEAALMYHVIAVDGVVRENERIRLAEILGNQFELAENQLQNLLSEAKEAEQEAIDLYAFTSVLKRGLSYEDRTSIIENLWEMVFADGVIHELEDNVVWRVAELLGVDSRDRMLLKQSVWKRQNKEEESPS